MKTTSQQNGGLALSPLVSWMGSIRQEEALQRLERLNEGDLGHGLYGTRQLRTTGLHATVDRNHVVWVAGSFPTWVPLWVYAGIVKYNPLIHAVPRRSHDAYTEIQSGEPYQIGDRCVVFHADPSRSMYAAFGSHEGHECSENVEVWLMPINCPESQKFTIPVDAAGFKALCAKWTAAEADSA